MSDAPAGDPTATSFLASLGARGHRRAEPRTSIAVAAAGCALGILGVLIVAGDTGAGDDDFNQVPGILLSALVVGAGFTALTHFRTGALATAGTVAAALGVPPLMFFLTFDQDGAPPYSTEAILIVPTIVWLVAYAMGPGRGRPFFLGAGLLGLWATALQLTEKVFDSPFLFFGVATSTFEPTFGDEGFDSTGDFDPGFGGSSFDAPDPTTIGLISIAFGVAYLLACRTLDRRTFHGVATPFALATLPTLLIGAAFMTEDLEQAGTGLLLVLIGAGLAYHGAAVWRRATSWVGGAVAALGAAVFLADMSDDATVVGMLFLAAGIGLVAGGHAIAGALDEPDEMQLTIPAAAMAAVSAPVAPTAQPASPEPPPPEDSPWAPPPPPPPDDTDPGAHRPPT